MKANRVRRNAGPVTHGRLNVRVPMKVRNRLERAAAQADRNLSQEVTHHLQQAFLLQDLVAAGLVDEKHLHRGTP
jgi:hypothetical protein